MSAERKTTRPVRPKPKPKVKHEDTSVWERNSGHRACCSCGWKSNVWCWSPAQARTYFEAHVEREKEQGR